MIEPEYIELVGKLIDDNPDLVAASSRIKTFGVLESVVRPSGGAIGAFLSHNCCPATHILRKSAYDKTSGYDETMRSGFEDWDFFLSMLETSESAEIGIVKKPLIKYRTAPASSNIKSMDKRLNLMKFIMDKHSTSYHEHMAEALLGIEAISSERLYAWENEIVHSFSENGSISDSATAFLQSPTYGNGGMAAAVRIMLKNGTK